MPVNKILFKNAVFIIWFCLFLVASVIVLQGVAVGQTLNHRIDTRYTIIQFESYNDLKRFCRKVYYLSGESDPKRIFSKEDTGDVTRTVIRKVDAIYERVQEILDMRKRMKKKVIIKIYPTKTQLQETYHRIYEKHGSYRAWYAFNLNTIFITSEDIHEGILAHEMGHAIIDNYLSVRPPSATAEILARYVDKHLFGYPVIRRVK